MHVAIRRTRGGTVKLLVLSALFFMPFFVQASLTDGLLGYWTFDGKDVNWQTSTMVDASGNGKTATLVSLGTSSAPVRGVASQALRFNGQSSAMVIPLNLSGSNKVTISFWMNWDQFSSNNGLAFEYTPDFNNSAHGFIFNPNDSASGKISVGNSCGNAYNVGNFNRPTAKAWHHYVITYNRNNSTTLQVGAIVDGVPQTITQTNFTACTNNYDNSSLYIMSRGATSLFGAGALDDMRLYNRLLSSTEAQQLYRLGHGTVGASIKIATSTSPTNLATGLIGYWTLDGKDIDWNTNKTTDRSSYGAVGTLTSFSTTSSSIGGKVGQALSFNGSNTYVNLGVGTYDNLVNDFSLSAWIKPKVNTVSQQFFGTGGRRIYFGITSGGKLEFHYFPGTDTFKTGASTLKTNTWYHVVATKSSSNGITLYVNGISDLTSPSDTGNHGPAFGGDPAVLGGSFFSTLFDPFNGLIDEVRVYRRVLSLAEVTQLYKTGVGTVGVSQKVTASGGTNSLSNGLVGYWTFDGKDTNWNTNTTNDVTGNGSTGTLVSMSTTTSPILGKIGQTFNFGNPIAGSITMGSSNAFRFTTESFTVSAWIKTKGYVSSGSGGNAIFGRGDCGGSNGTYCLSIKSNNTIQFQTEVNTVVSPSTYSDNKWHLVTGVRIGTTLLLYIDGALVNSGATANLSSVGGLLTIGQDNSGIRQFYGNIDDVRVYNRALSSPEIQQLYKQGAVKIH